MGSAKSAAQSSVGRSRKCSDSRPSLECRWGTALALVSHGRSANLIQHRHGGDSGETLTAAGFDHDIVHRLRDRGKTVDLLTLLLERDGQPTVVLSHLRKLRGDLARELDAMLQRRIRLQSLALDLLEQVRAAAQELVMGKLPCLDVRRGALSAGCLSG